MTASQLAFPLAAHPDESVNGYLLRLAEENFIDSVPRLLAPAKVRLKACYAKPELEGIGEAYGIDCSTLKTLAGFDHVRGSIKTGRFLRTALVPVCPECLRQHGYIRQAWHHQLVTACPAHKSMLVSACPSCDEPLDLRRPSVCDCRCGFRLSDAVAHEAGAADLFVASLLEPNLGVTVEGLGDVPDDIDAFFVYLANLTLPSPHRKNAQISWGKALELNQASYLFSEDLLPRFASFVEKRVADANKKAAGRFMASLGKWYRELYLDFTANAYAPVRDQTHRLILALANAPINRKMKQLSAEQLGLKAALTASEAARIVRSSPDRIVALVKSGQLPGTILAGASNEYCLVQRAEVEAHKQRASDFVHSKDLLKVLGVSRRVRDRLIEAGLLQPVSQSLRPLFAQGDFRLSEANALVAALSKRCPESPFAQGLALEDLSGKRFSSDQISRLFRKIFAGEIKPSSRLQSVYGLSGLRFDEQTISRAVEEEPGLIELTVTELSKLTGWKHETIKGWIDAGFLRARVDQGRRRNVFVPLRDLIEFLSTHIVAADAARRLNSKSVWLMQPLKTAGCLAEGAHETSAGTQRGVLFSTDALINIASKRANTWSRPSVRTPKTKGELELSAVVDRFCSVR